MYKQLHVDLNGSLILNLGSVSTYFQVDTATATALQLALNFAGGDWTYLLLDNGSYSEEIKVVDVNNGFLSVVRAQSDSAAQVFAAADTVITSAFGKAAVADAVQQAPQSINFTLNGTGLATVTGPAYARIVDVASPTFTGIQGVEVLGTWPNLTIGLDPDIAGCCAGEGAGGGVAVAGAVTSIVLTSTILQGNISNGVLSLSLATPAFTGVSGITVTGTYPNFVISGAGVGGGTSTTVTAGVGLVVTGNPSVNPTVSLTNTGVVAGDYSGFIVDAQGRITNLPAGFAFIKQINLNYGTVSVVSSVATLTIRDADVAIRGAVAMTNPAIALDSGDEVTAVSPAVLYAQVQATKGKISGTMSGEADASYTNTLASTALTIVLLTGEKLIIMGDVCVLNDSTPLTPIAYGVSVFGLAGAVSTKFYGSKIVTQSKQNIVGVITGPFTGSIAITTTALPAGSTLQGAYLSAVKAS